MAISGLLPLALGARSRLTEADRSALADLPVRREVFAHRDVIVSEGPSPSESCLLVSGMAMRVHGAQAGQHLVSALHVPGDFLDLHAFLLDSLDHDVIAQGDCTVEFVRIEHLIRITQERPHLTRLLWLTTLVDAKINRAWAAVGAMLRANERIAHLLCELHVRYGLVGLRDEDAFEMPLDQKDIAWVLGFSVAHTNRAIQDLRSRGMVEWTKNRVRLPEPDALAELARFDARYLEARPRPR